MNKNHCLPILMLERWPPLLWISVIISLTFLFWSVCLCTKLYFLSSWSRAIFFFTSLLVGFLLGLGSANISQSKQHSRSIGGLTLASIIVGACLEALTIRHIENFSTGALGSLRICVVAIVAVQVTLLIGTFYRWHPAKTTYRLFIASMLLASGAALGLTRATINNASLNLFPFNIAVRLGVSLPKGEGPIGGLSVAFIVLGISIGSIAEGLSRRRI